MYEFRCDKRLKTKVEESTRLGDTLLCAELEHLKIETRLIDEMFSSDTKFVVYYESLKGALKTKTIYVYRYDERLKTNVGKSTRLACTPLCAELEHLKIETRLTSETLVSEMGEYASVM